MLPLISSARRRSIRVGAIMKCSALPASSTTTRSAASWRRSPSRPRRGCLPPAQTAGYVPRSHYRHPRPRPAKPEDQERRGRRRFGAVTHHQVPRHPGLDPVRQRHRPLRRRKFVRCRRRARWFLVADQSAPCIGRGCFAPLGRVRHLRLMPEREKAQPNCWASSPPAPSRGFDRLWCSERGQHRMQHYHRCLVHRRDLELRGHQQVGERVPVGFWQDFYKGNYGRVAGGFEWEYVRRSAFPGYGGCPSGCASPSTSDNVFMTSLRWYPF